MSSAQNNSPIRHSASEGNSSNGLSQTASSCESINNRTTLEPHIGESPASQSPDGFPESRATFDFATFDSKSIASSASSDEHLLPQSQTAPVTDVFAKMFPHIATHANERLAAEHEREARTTDNLPSQGSNGDSNANAQAGLPPSATAPVLRAGFSDLRVRAPDPKQCVDEQIFTPDGNKVKIFSPKENLPSLISQGVALDIDVNNLKLPPAIVPNSISRQRYLDPTMPLSPIDDSADSESNNNISPNKRPFPPAQPTTVRDDVSPTRGRGLSVETKSQPTHTTPDRKTSSNDDDGFNLFSPTHEPTRQSYTMDFTRHNMTYQPVRASDMIAHNKAMAAKGLNAKLPPVGIPSSSSSSSHPVNSSQSWVSKGIPFSQTAPSLRMGIHPIRVKPPDPTKCIDEVIHTQTGEDVFLFSPKAELPNYVQEGPPPVDVNAYKLPSAIVEKRASVPFPSAFTTINLNMKMGGSLGDSFDSGSARNNGGNDDISGINFGFPTSFTCPSLRGHKVPLPDKSKCVDEVIQASAGEQIMMFSPKQNLPELVENGPPEIDVARLELPRALWMKPQASQIKVTAHHLENVLRSSATAPVDLCALREKLASVNVTLGKHSADDADLSIFSPTFARQSFS